MAIDESERIPKWRFYSSDQALLRADTPEDCGADSSKGAKIPKHCPLRRTCSVPTSFKERKRHYQTHKRSKTSPLPAITRRSTSSVVVPAERKRKWRALETRCPEQHDCRRWAYARRDEYNRYLIPRTSSTESTQSTKAVEHKEEDDQDDILLLGLAFVDE